MKRAEMVEFLKGHERYDTMNSWNRSTSYACNMKIYNVIPEKLQDKAYEILEEGTVFDDIGGVIADWEKGNDWEFQAGFNGRSGGYLVMYRGAKGESGRCYPGKSIDQGEDFVDWDISELKERVELVKSFDRLCRDIIEVFKEFCESFDIVEEKVIVERTVKVLQAV